MRPPDERRRPAGKSRYAVESTRRQPERRNGPPRNWRRAYRRVLWALALVFVACALAFAFTSPTMAVRRIRVRGLARLMPEEAAQTQALCRLPARTNLLRAPVARMTGVLRRLPWVARADVRRAWRWPATLEVRIVPRMPVAVLSTPAGRWEMDAENVPIRPARPGVGLPEIACATVGKVSPGASMEQEEVTGALLAVAPEKRTAPLPIAKIEVDQNADMCLNMRDNVVIRLGQVEELPVKLALVRQIYKEDPGIGAEVQSIDLRCPEAPACIPRSASQEAPKDTPRRARRLHRTNSSRDSRKTNH